MDFVKEAPATGFSGTGPIQLGGAAGQGDFRFREALPTGAPLRYCTHTIAGSPNGVKFETIEGVFSTGSPDQLTRVRILQSTNGGAAVDWLTSDQFVVYIAPLMDVLRPQMIDWVDVGAANYTLTAADNGRVFGFNVTAAGRTFTLIAGSTLATPPAQRYFRFGVYGYGHAANAVAVTPITPDGINGGSAAAAKNVVGNTGITWFNWDPVRSTLVTG